MRLPHTVVCGIFFKYPLAIVAQTMYNEVGIRRKTDG